MARDNDVVRVANDVMARQLKPTTREIFTTLVAENIGFTNDQDSYDFFSEALNCACHTGRLPRSLMVWTSFEGKMSMHA